MSDTRAALTSEKDLIFHVCYHQANEDTIDHNYKHVCQVYLIAEKNFT